MSLQAQGRIIAVVVVREKESEREKVNGSAVSGMPKSIEHTFLPYITINPPVVSFTSSPSGYVSDSRTKRL